jgi:hypothetical protein
MAKDTAAALNTTAASDSSPSKIAPPEYAFTLVVAHPFGDHERGSSITEAADIFAVLEGENASHVRKVNK